MCVEFPAIVLPFFVTVLGTMTPMYDGTPLVGGGLLPPVVAVQLCAPSDSVTSSAGIGPGEPPSPSLSLAPSSTSVAVSVAPPAPARITVGPVYVIVVSSGVIENDFVSLLAT